MQFKDRKVETIALYTKHLKMISNMKRSDFESIYGLTKDEAMNRIYNLINMRLNK
jgi:hypothetical protein